MACTLDVVRLCATLAEEGEPITIKRVASEWGRSYASTHTLVKHAVALRWLEERTLLPTHTGLEVCGRV